VVNVFWSFRPRGVIAFPGALPYRPMHAENAVESAQRSYLRGPKTTWLYL